MKLDLKTRPDVRSEQIEQTFHPAPCVLVYYDGGLPSLAALRKACAEVKTGTRIVAVYLDMVPLIPETAAQRNDRVFIGKAILAAAMVNAAMYASQVELLCLEAHTRGLALVQLATECGDSTIYMGTDPEHPDWLTDYLLANAPSNVVLVSI